MATLDSPGTFASLAVVFAGAGVGGSCRFLLGHAVQSRLVAGSLPWGTIVVNISGCLAIGYLARLLDGQPPSPTRELVRLGVLVGVLGGYTTFSSFGRETIALASEGRWLLAGANVLISNAAGLAAVWLGASLAR